MIMESFSVIWCSFLLVNVQFFVWKVDATITWTLPSPKRGPLTTSDSTVRTTLKVFDGRSPGLRLEWDFTLDGVALSFVSWNIGATGQIGSKTSSGAVTLLPAFQGQFNISPNDRATLIIYNTTAADGEKITCRVVAGVNIWEDVILVVIKVPADITEIRGEQTVHEGSNLELTCEALGKPEPNITWTKEKTGNQGNTGVLQVGKMLIIKEISRNDSGAFNCAAYNGFGEADSKTVHVNVTYQVCDKNTLHTSQVFNDANYICRVANALGVDSKTANIYVGGNVINITIVITNDTCIDGKFKQSFLLEKFEELLEGAFADKLGYEGVQLIGVRCGSIIVDLALKFNSTKKEQDVITTLNDAVKDGKLGEFSVGAIKGKRPDLEPTGRDVTSPLDVSSGESSELPNGTKTGIVVGAVFGSVAALAIAGILVCWNCRKKRRNTKGTEEVARSGRTFGNSSNETRGSTNIAVELPKPSQSHYIVLADRTRSQVMADASPLSAEQISEYASLNPYTRSWETPREHVTIERIVGKGAFGQVAKATAVNLQGRAKKTLVAVKMLKENASESERKDLLAELELMKQLKPHPYVIKLLGCVTKSVFRGPN